MTDRTKLLEKERSSGMSCFGSSDTDDLPSGLPNKWPNHEEEDLRRHPHRLINVGSQQDYFYRDNFVKTSKYTFYFLIWDFLPKFLLEEFNPKTKIANCYFFMIALLQVVPQISNTGGLPTTFMPLSVVVFIDGLFQVLEDLARHKADAIANASQASRFEMVTKEWLSTNWSALQVGDFVKIVSREQIPADILVLACAEEPGMPPRGQCYVETKQLDGETNLKLRLAMPNTLGVVKSEAELPGLKGSIAMEHPNAFIDTLDGSLNIEKIGSEAIQPANVLLRGCVLRNTEWIVGIVINSGHDTKIMMTSKETKAKTSNMQSIVSVQILRIVGILFLICFCGAIGSIVWNSKNNADNIWYLGTSETGGTSFSNFVVMFFYFFLLHATFIPVSLYVSMTLAQGLQKHFMQLDEDMYYDATDTPAQVRTMTLNEELGQISHIFSDKTGTLTCNIMDFRKFSVNGTVYGMGITEIGKASWKLQGKEIPPEVLEGERRSKLNSKPHVTFFDEKYDRLMAAPSNPERAKVKKFFRTLSICHDVIAEKVDGQVKLSASNPDDEALVCAADYFGYKFVDRRDKFIILLNKDTNATEEVELLESIEFSSKRKRMSVIVRDTDGKIRVYIKGADTVINDRLRKGQASLSETTNRDMSGFSDEGLRCLLVGTMDLDETFFNEWRVRYKAAKSNLDEIEKKKKLQPNSIEDCEEEVEKDIVLIGSTALEDRLQDGVPETIALLAKAGIKIWVLTGDKEETAINIAVACNLVLPSQYMKQVIINGKTAPTREEMIKCFDAASREFTNDQDRNGAGCLPRALIIDGPSLAMATVTKSMLLQDMDTCKKLKEKLLEFSQRCKAVVGCRVSPDQKREMVDLIKTGVDGVRTLAIGDGANDVAMIQEAHIGVGIKGEEGLQAVNSSDYAIAQFRYLGDLLLKHGRYNYVRMAGLVCYMFYKNVFMSMGQFWFNFNNAWSGQKYYNEAAIQMFNLLYTSIPIIAFAAYDKDITTTSVRLFPHDYQDCVKNLHFSSSKFWGWLVTAFIESTVVSVLPLYILNNSDIFGVESSFWDAGTMTYTCVVVVVNVKLLFIQNRWHWFNFFLIIGSMMLWLLTSILYSSLTISLFYTVYGTMQELLATPSYWCGWILICTIIVGKDIYFCALDRMFNYHNYHIIQEFEVEKNFANKEIAAADARKHASAEAVTGNPQALASVANDPSTSGSVSSRSPRAVGSIDMDAL